MLETGGVNGLTLYTFAGAGEDFTLLLGRGKTCFSLRLVLLHNFRISSVFRSVADDATGPNS